MLQEVPHWIIDNRNECLLLNEPSWIVLSYVWHYIQKRKNVTTQEIVAYLQQLDIERRIRIVQSPLVKQNIIVMLASAILALFMRKGMLMSNNYIEWVVL